MMEAGESHSSLGTMADKIGIPKDMFIFFVGEALCLLAAVLYRIYLPPGMSSSSRRHFVALVLGLMVGFFSFGREFFHVIIQSTVCYLFIRTLPSTIVHIVLFVVAMLYLVCLHLYRAFMIPEDVLYSIDVSGPLMIVTQKITSLAFGLYDGCHGNKDEQSDLQKRYSVSKPPSALEYFSYIFHFQGVVVGPLIFYTDYIAYVEGTDITDKGRAFKMMGKNSNNNNNNNNNILPSPYRSVGKKLLITAFWMGFHFTLKPVFPEIKNADPIFIQNHGLLYRLGYMVLSMVCCRAKYYVAFTLGDAVCNASGLGFNGYDYDGQSKWDLSTNVHILDIEGATSPKSFLDNWNIKTAEWLRHVCYDRLTTMKVLATFVLSAAWHGCYVGYYFTFLSAALSTNAARRLRRRVRPYFLSSPSVKLFYDVLTWILTHLVISYFAVPFTVLHFRPTVVFFNSLYWSLHIMTILVLCILPYIPTQIVKKQHRQTGGNAEVSNGTTTIDAPVPSTNSCKME